MRYLICIILLVALSGCKVGPDYQLPVTPVPVEYSENNEEGTFAADDNDLYHWWTIFDDPFLDELLEQTLAGSFDYRIALEQIYQARAQYRVDFAQIFPELFADFQATRYRTSRSFQSATLNPLALTPIQNFFQTGFDAIWEIDLFGRLRRTADAAYDLWEASVEEARGVKIVILSEVANTYAVICAFRERIDLAHQMVALDIELLELMEGKFEAGLASEQDVLAIEARLEGDRANLYAMEVGFKLNMYSLATLTGRLPESIVADFSEKRPIPYAVGRVPAGLPSELLRRRPDIRAAERSLAAATEEVGVAVAQLFPQISLLGSSSSYASNPLQGANVGYTSDQIGKLFNSASRIWGIGGLVTFPVFDFGRRVANVNVQESLRQQTYLSYQKTVVAALQEVEQALAAYFNDEKRVLNYHREAESYRQIYELTADEFQAGLTDYIQVVQAKEAWITALNVETESRQVLTTDLISVYKAMGGDW